MAERARATVKQWRVSRLSEQPKEERQRRRTRAQSKPPEEAVLADARQFEDPESVQQWDAGNKQKAKQVGSGTFSDAKLPSPACVPLGARGTNELGRTFPGGAGVRFFLFLFFFF